MAFNVRGLGCCAILELEDISHRATPDLMVRDLIPLIRKQTTDFNYKKPFLLFTSVITRNKRVGSHADRVDDYGLALADFIEANNLGTVDRNIEPGRNWTTNLVKIWLWRPNWDTIRDMSMAIDREIASRETSL